MGVVLKGGGAFVPITLACKLNKANMLLEKIVIKKVHNSKMSNSSIDIVSKLSGDPYHSFKSQPQYQNLHSVSLHCHCWPILSLNMTLNKVQCTNLC